MIHKISFLRFTQAHGRAVAVGQLTSHRREEIDGGELASPEVVMQGSVGEILAYAQARTILISNAQEILYSLVVKNGFAS